MACVLQIGAGGVGAVVAHKMAMNREVFSRIILASRNISKCQAIADSIRAKGLGEIEIDSVDADKIEEVVALIEKYKPFLVVNVALPYQDLSIMEACLRTKTHYLDTANYEHPDSAHFEYKEQWVYDSAYKEAGIFALLGSGFDPGVTNVFCAYAQKHYFDEIHSIDILDCNAGDHGYAFATNFNPEINLREVSSKARYWVKNSSLGMQCDGFSKFPEVRTPSSLTSENSTKTPAATPQNTRICKEELEFNLNYKTHTKEDSAFSSHSESFCHSETLAEESLKDVSATPQHDVDDHSTPHCHSERSEESKKCEHKKESKNHRITTLPYDSSMLESLLTIWEDSVKASHFFLNAKDIAEIKEEVKEAFLNLKYILVAKVDENLAGFIGVAEKRVEMLFVSPRFFSKGVGKRLLLESLHSFFAKCEEIFLDCNEDNERGLRFYQGLGFKQCGRSNKDSKGRNFPIIHFSISKHELASRLSLDSHLVLNPDLRKDRIYRKFEREEKHFKLESNTQDLKNESYFGGQWRDVAPLALMKEWEYPEVGVKNSYLLYHEELESLIRNIRGLKRIRFFMTFGESYLTHMKCLENVGLLRVDEVEHQGQKIVPIQVLKTLLPDPASLAPRTKGQTHIGCYITGIKDGAERVIYIYNICEHERCYEEVNAQGVSYTTGVPAMIGAKLICEGKWGVGSNSLLNSSLGMQCDGFSKFPEARTPSSLTSENSTKTPATTTQNTRICKEELESNLNYKTHTKEDSAFSSHSESFRHSEPTGEEYKDVSLTLNMTKTCHSECNEESKRDVSLNAQHDRGVSGIRPQNDANSHSDHTTHSAPHRHSERSEESNFIKARLSLNADMPQGGKEQGIDSHNGSGVWNMEQNDPDPFMQELNKQGLPYVVIEIDSNGKSKLLEDGRK